MAGREGTDVRKRKRANRRLKYFFLNDEFHRTIYINRPADLMWAWNYEQKKRVMLSYSQTRKASERCFTLKETAKLLGRGHLALERAILRGDVPQPVKLTPIDDEQKINARYMLSEKQVLQFHDYFSHVHIGRPNKYGIIKARKDMPNRRELLAMMRQETMLYVKTEDGFVPSWEADI